MARFFLSVLGIVLLSSTARAQQPFNPNSPPVKAPASTGKVIPTGGALPVAVAKPVVPDAPTLKHLENWDAAMKSVKQYYAVATKTVVDDLRKSEKVSDAALWLMKPNFVRVDVQSRATKPTEKGALEEMYISNGDQFYIYDVKGRSRKAIRIGTVSQGQLLLLDLMSGLSVKQMTDRFTVKTIKQDDDFVYLQISPVLAEDKESFQSITLYLCGARFKDRAYIPRRISIEYPQNKEVWDFPDPKVNPDGITVKHFDPLPLPKGWTDENMNAAKPPSAARPVK